MIFKAFLSYVPADRTSAEKLRAILSERDDVRLVALDVRDGEKWQTKLSKHLLGADLFIVLLSPDALRTSWLLQELGAAWGKCKAMIPIKTQPDVGTPVSLDGLVYFEMEEALKPENWDLILAAFEGVLQGSHFNFLTRNPLH